MKLSCSSIFFMISTRSLLLGWGGSGCSKKSNDMIQIVYYNMRRRVFRLDDGLLAVLSDADYTATIVQQGTAVAVISSEEKLICCHPLPAMRKTFMNKNRTVSHCYLFLVDRRLTWTLYRVKNTAEQPELLYTGTILSEQHELTRIVAVIQAAGKVLLVFDHFRIIYLVFPEQDQSGLPIFSKEFLPYGGEPEYEHAKLALRSYLPSQEEHELVHCIYRQTNIKGGAILVGYRSKGNLLSSIYTLQYNEPKGYLLCGRNILQNIETSICGIYPTHVANLYIIHTQNCLVLWNIALEHGKQTTFMRKDLVFRSNLSVVLKDGEVHGYTAVTNQNKVVLLRIDKKGKLEEQQLRIQAGSELHLIQVQMINPKSAEYYCLTAQEEVYLLAGSAKTKVVTNQHTSICNSTLKLHNNYNFIILEKIRGQQRGKLIYGNHLFSYQAEHYQHGMHLANAFLLSSQISSKQTSVYLSSPLLGLQKLCVNLTLRQGGKQTKARVQNSFQVGIESGGKLIKNQTLFLNNKYQINWQQVSQIGKKSTAICKLFQDSADYVTSATIFSNQLIVLAISDQIHIFDAKLARKYIYCCSGEVKRLFSLNEVNLLGVQLFHIDNNRNQLLVLILEQEKARKMKNILIPEQFDYLQLSTVINTAQFKINLFGNSTVVCSNDSLHRFQLEKILVQHFSLPLPDTSLKRLSLVPVLSLSAEKNNEFLIILREQRRQRQSQMQQVEIYFANFNTKYLFKKFDLANLTFSCQPILTLSQLPRDHSLFAVVYQFQQGKPASIYRNLMMIGERFASIFNLKLGRLQMQWLQDSYYLRRQLSKIQQLTPQITQSCSRLPVSHPISILPTNKKQYFLVYNSRQIYYTLCTADTAQQVSYYSLINDDFSEFRNNISVGELQDEEFMHVFNKKLVIRGMRYLSDRAILVLYDSAIIILEVGLSNALTVRQELKFKAHQGDPLQIVQFLQNYDKNSLYLRDAHGRVYILKQNNGIYQIILHNNMDEDVLLFSRISKWEQRERVYSLAEKDKQDRKEFQQELVLKKDGQLNFRNMKGENKFIYL